MRVMVTGAQGFLGCLVVQGLKELDVDVAEVVRTGDISQFSCDLTDILAVSQTVLQIQPDIVLHCAAFVPKSLKDYNNEALSSQNSMMLHHLIACTKCPIVYISSMTVYGESDHILRKEADAGNPQTAYGTSKSEGERLLLESGRDSLAIRIPGLFGRGRSSGIVANTLSALALGESVLLPEQSLIWAAMDVDDAAKIIVALCLCKFSGFTPVNVAYPGIYSINIFLKICEEIFGRSIPYSIKHPEFEFDLGVLKNLGVTSEGNLRSAMIKLRRS